VIFPLIFHHYGIFLKIVSYKRLFARLMILQNLSSLSVVNDHTKDGISLTKLDFYTQVEYNNHKRTFTKENGNIRRSYTATVGVTLHIYSESR
jgi:hypothetical protein